MSSERIRLLDPQAIEASEYMRKNNEVTQAAEIASRALGFLNDDPLSENEIAEICCNPEQRAILACLTRLHVDSLKSVANESIYPRAIISSLSGATRTINHIARNPVFIKAIESDDWDHLGREHPFQAEMTRDIQKTALAASVLYPKSDSNDLVRYGEELLFNTFGELPDNHPTKPLIGIEYTLSRLNRGLQTDAGFIIENFEKLTKQDIDKNPHRVATVASWFVVIGKDKQNKDIESMGTEVFTSIINKHPEWEFMVPLEIRKRMVREKRKKLIRLLSVMTTLPQERRKLKKDIINPKRDN